MLFRCSPFFRFVPSQWETALLCNDVSHWLGVSLEAALYTIRSTLQTALPVQKGWATSIIHTDIHSACQAAIKRWPLCIGHDITGSNTVSNKVSFGKKNPRFADGILLTFFWIWVQIPPKWLIPWREQAPKECHIICTYQFWSSFDKQFIIEL